MRVLPVLALCLVQLGLVQNQAITCTSNQPDTDCTVSNSCGAEHPPKGIEYDQYIDDTCDPGFSFLTSSMPYELERQLCPDYTSCDVAADNEESTRYEGRPEVNVRLETASLYQFDVHISWEHNPDTSRERRRGYQVQVRNEHSLIAECFCVDDRDARNLTITGSNSIRFDYAEDLTVEVAPFPLPNNKDLVAGVTGKNSSKWPSSCLDLGTHNCYPPTYPPPSNIQLCTYSESMSARRLDILWDSVIPHSSWNNTSGRFTYYIQLQHLEPFPDDDPLIVSDYFKVTSTRNTSLLSVSLYPLNISVDYTNILLLTHYPCSGLAITPTTRIGCGVPSTKYNISLHIPSCIFPSSSKLPGTLTSSSIPSSTPSPSPSPTIEATPEVPTPPVLTIAVVIPILTVLVVVAVTIMLIVLRLKKRNLRSEVLSINIPEPPVPIFKCIPDKKRVVVFFSLQSKNVEYILCSVVQVLLSMGDMEVTHPHDLVRGLIPEWIEDKVMKADTVLIVCDKAFYDDWNKETSPHINALRHVIFSKVMNSSSGMKKFAVVVLDNKDQYIPTEYLRRLSKFNCRKNIVEDVEPIVHFIRDTSPYLLASPDCIPTDNNSDPTSPVSDTTHGITSICTDSHTTSSIESLSECSSPITMDTSSVDLPPECGYVTS